MHRRLCTRKSDDAEVNHETRGATPKLKDFKRNESHETQHIQVLVEKPKAFKRNMEVWNNTFKAYKFEISNIDIQSSVSLFLCLSLSGWFWPIQGATYRSWPGRNLAPQDRHKLVHGHNATILEYARSRELRSIRWINLTWWFGVGVRSTSLYILFWKRRIMIVQK